MRAIQMTEFGGPEVLRLAELPKPEPGPEEVLIRVTRAGLNFADTHTRTNSYVQKATLPLVPGGEVAGIREDTGERVVALVGSGGYAEYATAPKQLVFPIKDELDDGTALALIVQGGPPGTCTAPPDAWRRGRASSFTPPPEASARSPSSSAILSGRAGSSRLPRALRSAAWPSNWEPTSRSTLPRRDSPSD